MSASCSDDLSVNDPEQFSMENREKEFVYEDQSNALDAFSALKNYYGLNTKSLQNSDDIRFPDYYGGSYINGNKLVVYIKEGTTDLPSILTENPDVILKEGKYSFSYLSDILNKMNEIYSSNSAILNPVIENIDMFALSETNNRIEVYLKDCSATAISDFKQYMLDSPAIHFIQAQYQEEEVINFMESLKSIMPRKIYTVNPGSQIGSAKDMMSNLTPGSLGYKATYNKKSGFVTAAHVANLNDTVSVVYEINKSNPIAKCIYSSKTGSVDIAFCEIDPANGSVTNNIGGDSKKVLSQDAFPNADIKEGLNVYLSGYQNKSSGVIQNKTTSSGGLTNLIAATYSSTNGDSGGLVYCMKGGKYYIIGIHRARTTVALSTNVHNIIKLGITAAE